jgi:hypothetical protein
MSPLAGPRKFTHWLLCATNEKRSVKRARVYARSADTSFTDASQREYAAKRGWTIAVQAKEFGSGAAQRELSASDRRRKAEGDRCSADVAEALDLTTSVGRAMAGTLSVFAAFEHDILRERVRAGLAQARQSGTRLGRPPPP